MVENLEDLREEFLKNGGHEITDAITVIKFMLSKGFSRRPELDEDKVCALVASYLENRLPEISFAYTKSLRLNNVAIDLGKKICKDFKAPEAKQREVKWPEKMKCHEKEKCGRGYPPCSSCGWNEAIDACMDKYLGDSK